MLKQHGRQEGKDERYAVIEDVTRAFRAAVLQVSEGD
jgi:hypothetical protein